MSAMLLDSEIALASDGIPRSRRATKRQELRKPKAVVVCAGITVMITASIFGTSFSIDVGAAPISSQQSPKTSESQGLPEPSRSSTIEPGKGVGPVALGDTREAIAAFFPLRGTSTASTNTLGHVRKFIG
jgi:hypothetical protein